MRWEQGSNTRVFGEGLPPALLAEAGLGPIVRHSALKPKASIPLYPLKIFSSASLIIMWYELSKRVFSIGTGV